MTTQLSVPNLTPRLVTEEVDEAIEFYRATLDAELLERHALPNGVVVHAALRVGRSIFSLAQRVDEWELLSPDAIGGSPVH